MPTVSSRRAVYRSTEQLRVVVPVSIAMSIASLVPLIDPRGLPPWVLLLSSFAWGALAWRLGRAGVETTRTGIIIKNPFRKDETIPWTRVRRFSVRRYAIFPLVGFVDLDGGESRHILGIQGPNPLFRPDDAATKALIDDLNRIAREARNRLGVDVS